MKLEDEEFDGNPTEILLANPVGRRRSRRRHARRRRPMTALQRKYFGPRRRARVTRMRRNPVAAASVGALPRRRSRRRRVAAYVGRARRRFSSSGIGSFISQEMMPASVGAAGALALDLAWGYLPLPATLTSGPLAPVVRVAGAVGIGLLAQFAMGATFGRRVLNGALTVTMYDLGKGWLMDALPAPAAALPAPGANGGTNAFLMDGWASPAADAGLDAYLYN